MIDRPTDFVASLAKGLKVIETFSADTPRQSVAEVSKASGLDRATARRCLLTLHAQGYADYDGKFFTLTPRILRLGTAALNSLPLPTLVQPWLDQLAEKTGQSCSVSILDETEIVYIARAQQRRIMSISLMPGSRLPAHCSSMGRVQLAAMREDDALRVITASDLSPRTANSLTKPDAIMAELRKVRSQGYALIDQELELGLRSIAVPLRNYRGETVAALNTGVAAIQHSVDDLAGLYLADLLRIQSGLQRVLR